MAEYFRGTRIAGSTAMCVASASSGGGSDARVTFAAPASSGRRNVLESVTWSYSTTPTGTCVARVYSGTSSGSVIFEVDVTSQGPETRYFEPLGATPGAAMTVTLTQAGSSIIGRLNAYGRQE